MHNDHSQNGELQTSSCKLLMTFFLSIRRLIFAYCLYGMVWNFEIWILRLCIVWIIIIIIMNSNMFKAQIQIKSALFASINYNVSYVNPFCLLLPYSPWLMKNEWMNEKDNTKKKEEENCTNSFSGLKLIFILWIITISFISFILFFRWMSL